MIIEDVEDSSIRQSEVTLTVVITLVVVIILVAVPVAIFSFVVWYRTRSLNFKHQYNVNNYFKMNPPTYMDLRKMSTIYDPDDIRQDMDTYNQASQKEYGITFMELQMMKTDKD